MPNRIGLVTVAVLALTTACATVVPGPRFECSDEDLADWEVPVGELIRRLSYEQALGEVVTGNLATDAVRDRWRILSGQFQPGDEFWFYRRSEEHWVSSVGGEEGVVLIRGCAQVGSVATSLIARQAPPGELATGGR